MFRILVILLPLLLLPFDLPAENSGSLPDCEIIIDNFKDGIDAGWMMKSFKGETDYTWVNDAEKSYIKATSSNTASSLYYEKEYDPRKYPYITWQWKVDNIIAAGDASRKSGDDYAARVYVVFPSFFFWNTTAINYIWANKLPQGEMVPNPFTANDMMISVESGEAQTGRWITETRNVYEDYRRAFGKEPPLAGGVAIMTDTDNTGESATAYYGPIAVCGQNPGK